MVNNPPSNAGDVGLIPGGGTKIPHAAGQLSPCATTREPKSQRNTPQATTKIPHATTNTRCSHINKLIN